MGCEPFEILVVLLYSHTENMQEPFVIIDLFLLLRIDLKRDGAWLNSAVGEEIEEYSNILLFTFRMFFCSGLLKRFSTNYAYSCRRNISMEFLEIDFLNNCVFRICISVREGAKQGSL